MSECVLLVEHSVKYTNRQPLEVKDVIDSLSALQKVSVFFLPEALSQLSGAAIVSADLLVEGFQHGSFVEDVLIKLVFKDQAEMDKFLEKVREGGRNVYRNLPGNGSPILKGAVAVTCVVGALVAAGAVWAIATRTDTPAPISLSITDSNFVVIGAESYKVSPKDFADVIEKVGGQDKKKLAQASAKILAPAKREPDATVVMDNNDTLAISKETIDQIPDVVEFEPFEIDQPHSDVDVEIRASDRDSASRGWAAIITGLVDRRVKLILDPGIDPNKLAGKFKVRADVVVKSRMSAKTKKMEPTSITVTSLIDD